jgi:hypothetical protein
VISKPTLIVQTVYFPVPAEDGSDPERAAAAKLGQELYELLTRPLDEPLTWGAGIPVRVAARWEQVDASEAEHVVAIPLLGDEAFFNVREEALNGIKRLDERGIKILPVFLDDNWRTVEDQMPKPILTELYAEPDPRRATINEILLYLARVLSADEGYSSQLFISHAKADLPRTGNAAEQIRAYVTSETTGKTFFDKVSILPGGEGVASQIEREVERGVFVAVRGDRYSSRTWCRRELLRAKQHRLPTLIVEVLSTGEARSAAYGGNGPTVVWDRAAKEGVAAGAVVTLAMVEAVRHLFFLAESRRVVAAAGLPATTERLARPPELLDLVTLRARPDASLVVLHPDPPLPTFERALLEEADKRLRLVTPTTAFASALGSSLRAPLDGWRVALSISDLLGEKSRGGAEGIAAEHLNDATVFLARALIGMGAAIAYGGDFRERSFTSLLARLVLDYNETARRNADFLHCYLGATVTASGDRPAHTAHSMRRSPNALLSAPIGDVPLHRKALHFSDLRRAMTIETQARVILGGNSVPKSRDPKGYGGRFPGVVEEAWRSLESGAPLYVAGGFGGAAELVVAALERDEPPPLLTDATWAGDQEWDALAKAIDEDPDTAKLGLPKSQEAMAEAIRSLGARRLASDEAALAWNGLTVEENRVLFHTRDPLTLTALVAKGLNAVATQKAQGKLRVELVEGDVSLASDLDVVVFSSFRDVPLDGAGAALDRLSGGAATRAHETGRVAAASRGFGASFVYAADLGDVSSALANVQKTVERATIATANELRRSGFARVGIVTFLGNVAPNLGEVVTAMVGALRSAADTSEFFWFERDPMRAAIIATALDAHPALVLTRRAAPVLPAPPAPGKKRTVIAVRLERGEVDVSLLLHRANGLAPVVRTQFPESDLRALAGKASDAAPSQAELAKRGARIAELLFGADAARVLGSVAGSELVVLHDDSASGIPYEALSWSADGKAVTPATSGGLVRHLLVPGIVAERALTRPPRAGRLGILVVINPLGDLPGAEEEGNKLLQSLDRNTFDVRELRGNMATIAAVREAIADPTVDVFHYCGHAFFAGPGLDDSGLNCSDGPLTLAAIREVQSVPRLAFVNACQAGRVRGIPSVVREPEAFAEFFLRAGVDAYLGTFWLVSDQGAALFAASVYSALTKGIDLGAAVIDGRKRLQEGSISDWANYVLYGDTTFRLVRSESSTEAAVDAGELSKATFRVDGSVVVASWTFPSSEAPSSFHVAAVNPQTSAPVELVAPMRVERREGWTGSTAVATWVVTVVVRGSLDAPVQLRPSAGAPVDVEPEVDAARRAAPEVRGVGQAGTSPVSPVVQLQALLDQQPDGGRALLLALQPSAVPEELRAQIDEIEGPETRALWPFTALAPASVDAAALEAFVRANDIPPIDAKEAERQQFQTKEDWAAYVFASGAVAFTTGGDVRAPLWRKLERPAAALTHEVRQGEFEGGIELALFSDNGNGLHPALSIARQIVDAKLPYAFHLGDVYYGGSKEEFSGYFEKPLQAMFDRTELFMISGNHEMYSKGEWFQDLIERKAKAHPNRQRQCGEMFRLRGPGFQVIGLDTMFIGWDAKRFRLHDRADEHVLDVLNTWLSDQPPEDLTILLTTNEPWDLGSKKLTPLYESLRKAVAGRVDLWFWGNVHYAALYDRWDFRDTGSPARGLVGSCIGHGGYPFYTQRDEDRKFVPDGVRCRWLETKSRFWPDSRLRPEVGANGWCRVKLERAADQWKVGLTYVDWVGRDRVRAALCKPDGHGIRVDRIEESDQAAVGAPLTWKVL